MVAWMTVVIFQAIVHYGLIGNKRRQRRKSGGVKNDDNALEDTSSVETSNDMSTGPIDDEEEDDLFQQPEIQKLLSQTGCELMSSCRSERCIEERAHEQLQRTQ
eukprot:CAMPEP_0194036778 /NCGR_PEP_ID=MMETSP0009_2-20130614/9147_1 /TAXON_ID=210454 /ORGANISM="Grammatophora oceanica, Strain CCMP 410" /LENGTH=103 /DNA_ID=CAMNT_0038678677 /DNA_START=72 /DNA_END=383 /DNA_ORIENTATION=+